jgi:glycosyltransferase involved in cell wall biosynthesis
MNQPIRVLQFIDSLARAGAEQSLVSLATHLRDEGIDLHVACLIERDGLRADLEQAAIPIRSLAHAGPNRRRWLAEATSLVRELQPDVVHTTLFEADLAGRRAAYRTAVPCVSSLVNTAYGRVEANRDKLSWIRVRGAQAADMVTARRVTRFHALTRHVAMVMGQRLRISADKIEVIPRGRDAAQLGRRTDRRRVETRQRLGFPADVPIILSVGRQEPQKGQDVLLEALPSVRVRHPDVRVLIAGREGRATEILCQLIRDLDLSDTVTLLGARGDVADLLAAADVLAFPSLWEGAGGTLLESMALECPIVTSRLPVLLETVDAAMAEFVRPGDVTDLGRGLLAVLADRAMAADRARVARKHFESEFTIQVCASRMARLYSRVAATA